MATHPAPPRAQWDHRSILVPGLWAGILFVAALMLSLQQGCPGATIDVAPLLPDSVPAMLLYALPMVLPVALVAMVGLALSALPLLAGVTALAALGRWNAGTRHPAFWALVGAAAPAAVLAVAGAALDAAPATALILTGAACAALARRYVRWPRPTEE